MPRLPNGRGGYRFIGVSRAPGPTIYNDIRPCARCGVERMVNQARDGQLCKDCKPRPEPKPRVYRPDKNRVRKRIPCSTCGRSTQVAPSVTERECVRCRRERGELAA